MSVIAVVGWKFSKDELIDAFHCKTTSDFEETMRQLYASYDYYIVDEDYTNVVFGKDSVLCDNWTLLPINLENTYAWYKDTKHQLMLNSKHYLPFNLVRNGVEPMLYFISDGE